MRRVLVLLTIVAVVVVGLAPASLADPKKGETFFLECEGVPSGSIVTNGNGQWTPGLDLASNGVYIPYAFEFTFFFTPEGGEEFPLGSDFVEKRAPNNAKNHPHGVCTFEATFPVVDDPDLGNGTIRLDGTVWVFYTG